MIDINLPRSWRGAVMLYSRKRFYVPSEYLNTADLVLPAVILLPSYIHAWKIIEKQISNIS